MATGLFGHVGPRTARLEFAGVGVVLVSLLLAVVGIGRVLRLKAPQLTLSSLGLKDYNLSSQPIPWSAIAAVSPHHLNGRLSGVRLKLEEGFLRAFPIKTGPKLLGPILKTVGTNYVTSTPGAAHLKADDYYEIVLKYWTSYSKSQRGVPPNV